jgi:alpha-D-xyloside xylohydrolase
MGRAAVAGVLLLAAAALPKDGAAAQEAPPAAQAVLESDTLRLEVATSPYSYRVLERASGAVLLQQIATDFQSGGTGHRLTSASRVDRAATRLDLDVADPATSAHLTFSFVTPAVLRVHIAPGGTRAERVAEHFRDAGEQVYGIWEYPFDGRLDDRGTAQPFQGLGRQPGINFSSGRAPFYLTSAHYGVYAEAETSGAYRVAVDGETSFAFDVPELTYDVLYGPTPADILQRYRALAGGAVMPPGWAFDSVWWKDDDHDEPHEAANAQQNVLDTAAQLRAHQIPAGALWVDRPYGTGTYGWGNVDFDQSFPDPSGMVRSLEQLGLKTMVWIANRAWNRLGTEGAARGYLMPHVDPALGPAVDLRNPAAYAWLEDRLQYFADLGVAGYKVDRGEAGEQPFALEDTNQRLFLQLARQTLTRTRGDDVWLFARDLDDTARASAGVWNGDANSDFQGLRYSMLSGLRSGLINLPMWGSDTGGYNRSPTAPDAELFARWLELSAYSPFMEVLVGAHHTPWYDYDDELVRIAREQARAHHDLMPYARSLVLQATRTGMPLLRPLFLVYPDDAQAAGTQDEYLYGSELLVAPILDGGARSRGVYLPPGRWVDQRRPGAPLAGGQVVQVAAPLDVIPVFAREGAIIPRGDVLRTNNTWTPDWTPSLRVELFPSSRAASAFPFATELATEDVRDIAVRPSADGFEIRLDDLGLPGTLEVHLSALGAVQRGGVALRPDVDYAFDPAGGLLRLPFAGAATFELEGASGVFDAPLQSAP